MEAEVIDKQAIISGKGAQVFVEKSDTNTGQPEPAPTEIEVEGPPASAAYVARPSNT